MNIDQRHRELVRRLAKPDEEILASLRPGDCHLLHMAVGVAGEVGELIDAIKRAVIYRKTLDMENVLEELGDIEFYLSGIRDTLGIGRDEALAANIAKLERRYPSGGYTNSDATNRADKAKGGDA